MLVSHFEIIKKILNKRTLDILYDIDKVTRSNVPLSFWRRRGDKKLVRYCFTDHFFYFNIYDNGRSYYYRVWRSI